jgi:predicted DNA-binding transcriptional regulator AlpA
MRGVECGAAREKEAPMSAEILLTVEEAATRLKISKHTLNRWRVTGEGPPFVKYGPRLVRYIDRVLDDWAAKRTHGSTSEYGRESAKAALGCAHCVRVHAARVGSGRSGWGRCAKGPVWRPLEK